MRGPPPASHVAGAELVQADMRDRLVGARPDLAFAQHVPAVAEGEIVHQRHAVDVDIVEGADQPVEAGGERGGGLRLGVVDAPAAS